MATFPATSLYCYHLDSIPHGGKVHDGRYTGEVLQDDPARAERHLHTILNCLTKKKRIIKIIKELLAQSTSTIFSYFYSHLIFLPVENFLHIGFENLEVVAVPTEEVPPSHEKPCPNLQLSTFLEPVRVERS